MATYDIVGFHIYSGNTGSVSFFSDSPTSGTLNDSEADGTFEKPDAVLGPSITYVGQVNVPLTGGGSMLLPLLESGPDVAIAIPAGSSFGDFVFPNPLDVSAVDTSNFTVCYGAGSRIATPDGETAVQDLRIGDLIVTWAGETVPVKWIGQQTVHKLFAGPRMEPVRIRAGALGDGLPHSDLTVTADHGMIVDGLVINASALVNSTTIDFVPLAELPDRVTYYHIETEAHDVILANGAPAETFVDCAGRQAFDNYQEYVDLYGAERIIHEMDRPRLGAQRLVPQAIRDRLGIPAEPEFDWDDLDLWDDENAA